MSHKTPRLPSASQYSFARNPSVSIPRCSIKRPFTHKTTMNAGMLYPLYCEEVLPGDTFNVQASVIARLTTPIVPFMDNLYFDMHFFYVPYRLVWEHWVNMCGEQANPSDTIDYVVPTFGNITSIQPDGLYSCFGLPYREVASGARYADAGTISCLPFRAYNLIWNEWYRDQNIQNSVSVPLGDGPDNASNYSLLRRNKRKDYFTSALPWPQKGDAIGFSLTGSAPVVGNGTTLGLVGQNNGSAHASTQFGLLSTSNYDLAMIGSASGTSVGSSSTTPTSSTGTALVGRPSYTVGVSQDATKSGLIADLSQVSQFSINELRTAFQIQRMLEKSARGGTRYTELLYTMFGVSNPDSRLQRPELLGTFTIPVELHTVPQSSGTEEDGLQKSPQGNLSAFGLANGVKHGFDKSFTEYGVVIGLASIRAENTYQQGLPRMFSRRGRFDFYWPALAHLGEQAILNKEIYFQNDALVDDQAFGYQERWSEYKYSPSRVSGQLVSTYAQSLDVWHLAQKFDALPTLNSSFIRENPPLARVLAVEGVPQFVVDSFFDQNCVRPMPLYSIPGLIDHF